MIKYLILQFFLDNYSSFILPIIIIYFLLYPKNIISSLFFVIILSLINYSLKLFILFFIMLMTTHFIYKKIKYNYKNYVILLIVNYLLFVVFSTKEVEIIYLLSLVLFITIGMITYKIKYN